MKKILFVEIPLCICVFYTVLNIYNSIYVVMKGVDVVPADNNFYMLLWCALGTFAVYSQKLFPERSPLAVLFIAYIISTSIVLVSIYIIGLSEPLHPDAFRDAFRSFSIPYWIGAVAYYIGLYMEARQQNEWVQEIRSHSDSH